MAGLDRFQYVYPSVQLQDILKLAQKPASSAISTPYNSLAFNDPLASFMTNENSTQKIMPSQFGLANKPSLQFATPGGDFVQVFGPLKTPGNDKFFHDPNPLVIQRRTRPVTYVQKINLAYYKPPAPPPPGPVIIKEVRISFKVFSCIQILAYSYRFVHNKHRYHLRFLFAFGRQHHHHTKHP